MLNKRVLRADDPTCGALLAEGWQVVAKSWGAELTSFAPINRRRNSLDIRELGTADVPAILTLDGLTADDYPGDIATEHVPLTPETADPTQYRRAFGAFFEHQLVGLVYFDIAIRADDPVEVALATVHPSWRRRGIATALLDYALSALAPSQFRTGGSADNAASVALSRRLGFVVDEEWLTLAPPQITKRAELPSRPDGAVR